MDVVEDIDPHGFLQLEQDDIYGFDEERYSMILLSNLVDLVGNHNF
jgi:hypothetical protein